MGKNDINWHICCATRRWPLPIFGVNKVLEEKKSWLAVMDDSFIYCSHHIASIYTHTLDLRLSCSRLRKGSTSAMKEPFCGTVKGLGTNGSQPSPQKLPMLCKPSYLRDMFWVMSGHSASGYSISLLMRVE